MPTTLFRESDLEEIAEGLLKTILRPVGFIIRGLVWLVWDFCFEIVAWYVGWPVCRLVTLGSMPGESIHGYERASSLTAFSVSAVGLIVLVVAGAAVTALTGAR